MTASIFAFTVLASAAALSNTLAALWTAWGLRSFDRYVCTLCICIMNGSYAARASFALAAMPS
jgi:hypothetical protein